MTALADVRAERRDFTGAESLYQRALAVNEMAYGPDDARLANPLANLAFPFLNTSPGYEGVAVPDPTVSLL